MINFVQIPGEFETGRVSQTGGVRNGCRKTDESGSSCLVLALTLVAGGLDDAEDHALVLVKTRVPGMVRERVEKGADCQ